MKKVYLVARWPVFFLFLFLFFMGSTGNCQFGGYPSPYTGGSSFSSPFGYLSSNPTSLSAYPYPNTSAYPYPNTSAYPYPNTSAYPYGNQASTYPVSSASNYFGSPFTGSSYLDPYTQAVTITFSTTPSLASSPWPYDRYPAQANYPYQQTNYPASQYPALQYPAPASPYPTQPQQYYPSINPNYPFQPSTGISALSSLSGNWGGTWVSTAGSQGGATLFLTQSGTSLNGTLDFTDQFNQPKLNATVTGFASGISFQLSAVINAGIEAYNLTILCNVNNGNVLSGTYRITNSSGVDQESGTINLNKY